MAIVLKDCFYVGTLDRGSELKGADIVIEGNRITAVGKDAGKTVAAPERVIDCSRHVVVPGFVNTHHHFYQTLTRNLKAVQDAKLFDWLIYLYDIWKHLDRDAIYWSTMLAAGELLKTGCNLLLLDEPTNDLDVDTLRALEDAILAFAGCVAVISHDRWFLDRIATHMLAFEGDSRVEWFEGNYQDYEADRRRRLGAEADRPHRIKYRKLTR